MAKEITKKLTFSEQYKHPLWQKKRLEVLEDANFSCYNCGDEDSQLHAHHKLYIRGRKLWEYDETELVCLCSQCHDEAHNLKDELSKAIAYSEVSVAMLIGICLSNEGPLNLGDKITSDIGEVDGRILSAIYGSNFFARIESAVIDDIVNKRLNGIGESPALDSIINKINLSM